MHRKPGPSGFADVTFAGELSNLLEPVDTAGMPKLFPLGNGLRLVYQLDDYQPIWVKANYSSNAAAQKLIEELEDMRWDGVDPEKYNLAAIKDLKTKLDTTRKNVVADAIRFDTMLTAAYLSATRFLLLGSINPRKADSLWFHSNDSVWEAPILLAGSAGKYPSLNDFRSTLPTYQLLRREYQRYCDLANDSSYINAAYNLQQPSQSDSVLWLSAGYVMESELPVFTINAEKALSTRTQMIMAYQYYKSLRVTGKLDSVTVATLSASPETHLKKLRANMERIRWMKRNMGGTYIVVNVPLMELFFRKDSVDVMHKKIVVGRPERQTPSLCANMTNIVINPPWGVPPTILKNDVLPGIQKSGKAYLNKKGLKVFDQEGKAVSATNITAKNYKRYVYRQAPGDDNSLGYVKFNMPNKWNIYLHDTPHREDFGKEGRALSSGCIRVHAPQEMALYILSELEDKKNYTQGKLDTMIATHKTKSESLKNKIPVFITYLTAFEDSTGNNVRFTKDIYNRDEKLMALMNL